MPRLKRFKTDYPGVYYVVGKPLKGAEKPDRIYYVRFRKNGKEIEEKAGREMRDRMTPEKAVKIRTDLINGNRLTRKEIREQKTSVALYLSQYAYNILINEKNRSGRNVSEIMERAFLSIYSFDNVSPNEHGERERVWDKIRSQIEELKEKQTDEQELAKKRVLYAFDRQIRPENAIIAREDKYREILEHSFDVIYRLNLITGKFEYVSPATSKDWMVSPEELLPRIDQEILINHYVHPDDREKVWKHMNEAAVKGREGEGSIIEFRARIAKGKKYGWFSNTHTIVFDDADKPVALVGNVRDVTERKKVEQKTLTLVDQLEKRVKDYAASLEESNAALKILLKQNQEEKHAIEEKVFLNMKELVLPVVEKLKYSNAKDNQKYIGILESSLNRITSSFSSRVTSKHMDFTRQEVQVANYVMNGKTTKEIAGLMGLSERTIDFHRTRIRKKMGLVNTKESLRTHLLSLQ